MRQHKYEYDAFISHAVEDKIPIANELCARLEQAGLKIWYSGKELGIGDSIEKTIEKGLNRSRYGIVIFSPTYLAKNWTIREFYTLLAKEIEEQKVILPVLYNITLDELKNKDLMMADRFAVHSDRGIDFVVDRLLKEIRKPKTETVKVAWFSRIWLMLFLSLFANVALLLKGVLPLEKTQSEDPRQLRSSLEREPEQLFAAAMVGEMQDLLKRMNGCTCRHQPEQEMPKPARAGMKFTANTSSGSAMPGQMISNSPRNNNQLHNRGKMTMAVVFQIETPSEPEQPVEQEMNEMLEAITLADTEDPFIKVSNRESEYKYECVKASAD